MKTWDSHLMYGLMIGRGVSSLGSARNLAREPHVFKSSARLGSIFGSSGKLDIIFFGSRLEYLLLVCCFQGA